VFVSSSLVNLVAEPLNGLNRDLAAPENGFNGKVVKPRFSAGVHSVVYLSAIPAGIPEE
jgi:hypothetical protein